MFDVLTVCGGRGVGTEGEREREREREREKKKKKTGDVRIKVVQLETGGLKRFRFCCALVYTTVETGHQSSLEAF